MLVKEEHQTVGIVFVSGTSILPKPLTQKGAAFGYYKHELVTVAHDGVRLKSTILRKLFKSEKDKVVELGIYKCRASIGLQRAFSADLIPLVPQT